MFGYLAYLAVITANLFSLPLFFMFLNLSNIVMYNCHFKFICYKVYSFLISVHLVFIFSQLFLAVTIQKCWNENKVGKKRRQSRCLREVFWQY